MIDPTVHARAVEHVFAVRHASDLLLRAELAQAHRAPRRGRRGLAGAVQVTERRHGEKLADEERGESRSARRRGLRRPSDRGSVGVEEVGEAEEVEERGDERAEPRKERERVEEELGDQHFRIPYRKSHRRVRDTLSSSRERKWMSLLELERESWKVSTKMRVSE